MSEQERPVSGANEQALQAEIARLNKIIQTLMNRAERNASIQGSDFNLFQTAITLEDQVRQRTVELEEARLETEKITRALRKRENNHSLLLENSPVSIHEIDMDGRIISMSRAGILMHGLKEEGNVKGSLYLDGVSAADRERIGGMLTRACAGEISHFEFKASGPREPIFKSCFVPIKNKNGDVEKLMGITEDITERKRAEEELQLSNVLLTTQQEASIDGILVVDENDRILSYNRRFVELWGLPAKLVEDRVDEPVLRFVTAQMEDPQSFFQRVQYLYEHRQETIRDELILTDGRFFDRYSAPMIGSDKRYLGRVWYFRDITERKRAEAALRKSEERFKQLAEVFPETIFEANMKGDVTYANEHGLKHFGLTQEDIAKGVNIFDMVSPHDRNLTLERIQSRIHGDNKRYLEYQALKKDGSTFYALALSVPIMVDGVPVGIRGFILDITERKQLESQKEAALEALRESEERIRAITNSAQDAITMMDNNGNISYWNPAAEYILGYTNAEAIGRNLHELLAPERFLPAQFAAFPEFQKTGRGNAIGKTLELAARRKDGREIDVALSLSVVKIEEAWHAVGIMQDITARKRAEEALRESEERYRFLADHTADHIWTMDLSLHFIYSSPAVLKILGYTVEELMAKTFDQFFTPESFVKTKKVLMEELEIDNDPSTDPNRIHTLQSEHYHKNGQLVWLESSLTFIRDAEMRPVGILGVSRNITERKKAEEQIQHLATHDLLTDLPSLRLAKDRVSAAINMARRYKKAAAVMFIDLDGFKAVNDTLGHDAGDYILKQVALRLLSCVRETDTVARVGGDEFLIIATEINSPENAAQIARKVIQLVSQPVIFKEQQAVVGTSIGIALFPDHGENMDQLIKLADEAMYKVKNSSKNGFRFVKTTIK